MTVLILLLSVSVLFLFTAYLVIYSIGPSILLKPLRQSPNSYRQKYPWLTPREAGLPQEDVAIATADGHTLRCWLIRADSQPRGTVIYIHGVGDNRISGIGRAKLFHEHGFHVLLPDMRRHGQSGGEYCTYGYHEKHDVSRMIDFLHQRRDLQVGRLTVFGLSMGAATALQTAVIDDRIHLVISEGCFTDLRTIALDYQQRYIKVRSKLTGNIVMRHSEQLAKFDASQVSPLDAVQKIKVPVLFTHGKNDLFISPKYSRILYEHADEPKDLYFIDEAKHSDVWETGGPEYKQKLLDFIKLHLD
ncbi:MAG: alpha/beta hydrolase [Bacteroidota bacterium]